MVQDYTFTSESVTEGHPDKVADRISDSVLDAVLTQDPKGRVACETLVTTGLVLVAGEITTSAYVDIPRIARKCVMDIGYDHADMGFDGESCAVITSIDEQSTDIAQGVNEGQGLYKEQGAGDQGLMFGYACNETPDLMPAPIQYAHALTMRLAQVRRAGDLKYLRPDGKSQVSVRYHDGKPVHIDAVVVSTQTAQGIEHDTLQADIIKHVIKPSLPANLLTDKTTYLVNPTGQFYIGGPAADTGLTGRKIIVDTYGGMGRHGGGAFSGKDPSKVDRSASYMCRYVAKNVVAAGLADRCELQVAYAIGYPDPVSLYVNTFGTGKYDDVKIANTIREIFCFKPASIIKTLDLLRPIYHETSAYGHFGRDHFSWEKTNRVDDLRKVCR